MQKEYASLQASGLFAGIPPVETAALLAQLGARYAQYEKGEAVLWQGAPTGEVGVVLAGSARTVKTGADGTLTIVTLLGPGSPIGALLAASFGRQSPVTVQALSPLRVLFLPLEALVRPGALSPAHSTLLRNYLNCIAEKSMVLHDRIDCMLRPTVREKVLAYLGREAARQGGCTLTLPLNRSAMAEYLHVERSALSRELAAMKRDGLIDYYKNSFRLL